MTVTMESEDTCQEVSKAQWVRLADVILIAPFLGYIAYSSKGLSDAQKMALYAIAVGTLWYNGKNYLATQAKNSK